MCVDRVSEWALPSSEVGKDRGSQARGYLRDGGTPLPLWLWGKTRRFSGQMYRSDGKVLIKLLRRLTSFVLCEWDPRSSEGLWGAEIP